MKIKKKNAKIVVKRGKSYQNLEIGSYLAIRRKKRKFKENKIFIKIFLRKNKNEE